MNMKRVLYAATESEEDTKFEDTYDSLEEDFDYILDGLTTMKRNVAQGDERALTIMTTLSNNLKVAMSEIAAALVEADSEVE